MDNNELERYFQNSTILQEPQDDPEELVNLAGYQVTKAELFAHTREPAITIWDTRVKFNMACLRRFPGCTHIQILIHPEQKRLIIRPCDPDAPDALRWARGGGEKELQNRDLLCKIFAAKVFDLMGWDNQYRYKMMGKPAICDNEMLFLLMNSLFSSSVYRLSVSKYTPTGGFKPFSIRISEMQSTRFLAKRDTLFVTIKSYCPCLQASIIALN